MVVEGRFDLSALGISVEQWLKKTKPFSWHEVIPPKKYNRDLRDMRQHWSNVCSVAKFGYSWGYQNGLDVPGSYALVYDPEDKNIHPVTGDKTIIFGETTQDASKRITHTAGALKGHNTNMSSKWERHKSYVERSFGLDDIRNHLKDIKIWFRPHNSTDPDWQHDRTHSELMEQWAHAFYYSINRKYSIANTRDLPSTYMIETARKFLESFDKPL
jgi:hypothetical protein